MLQKRLALLIILLASAFTFFYPNEKGFSLKKIRSSFTPSAEWKVENLSPYDEAEVRGVLNQEYHYLASGAQSYAFLSKDGRYVLKFFKKKHLTPKNWLRWIPLPGMKDYRIRKVERRIQHKRELFSSYKSAFENLKEETGLLFVHLNKSNNLGTKVLMFDRSGKRYAADLDDYEFVLQKKAMIAHDYLSALIEQGEIEKVKGALCALLSHVVRQCKKGYIDQDTGVGYNYGFIGNRVIHFDVGRVIFDEGAKDPACYQREILRIGKKLEAWITLKYPDWLLVLDEAINASLGLSQEI